MKSPYRLLPSFDHVSDQDGDESHKTHDSRSIFEFPLTALAICTASLPLTGFCFCLFWSLAFEFTKTTATHCNTYNFLPSLSAATGSFYPQKYIWKHSIALHTVPRLLVATLYHTRHGSWFILILNTLEILSLLGLALIGSNENYTIHSRCFCIFLVSSLLYMFITSYSNLFLWCRETLSVKKVIAWSNLCLMTSATYFFLRHNSRCEPFVYSFFALSEYLIVLSNIYFHSLAYYDLSDVQISLTSVKQRKSLLQLA